MTKPQSCRECRHARDHSGELLCEWMHNVNRPWWDDGVSESFGVLPDDGTYCQAFERKDDADDE